MPNKKTHEQFVSELKEKNQKVEVVGRYVDSKSKVSVRCVECGYTWEATPGNLLNGSACPQWRQHENYIDPRRKSQEDFVSELKIANPKLEVLGQYISSNRKIEVRCLICDNVWFAQPSHLLNGHGCPRCQAQTHTSFPEQAIYYYLSKSFSDIQNGYKLNNRDTLDIYIPSKRIAIEYDGLYWHKNKVQKDITKTNHCNENDITLIRIREKGLPEIEGSINIIRDISEFKESLEDCIRQVLIFLNVPNSDINLKRDSEAIQDLYLNENLTDLFCKRLQTINPDIEVLTPYVDALAEITVRCKRCGHVWIGQPNNLLRGHGCAKCSGHYRRTQQDFENELKDVNPDIEVIGKFSTLKTKLKVRCKTCNNVWDAIPQSILSRGVGCPKCSGVYRRTHSDFINELAVINPNIEILGEYTARHDPILCKCKLCGTEWTSSPGAIFSGKGCPNYRHHENRIDPNRKTQEQFENELKKVNPSLEVQGKYINSETKIQLRCTKCGYVWSARPANVLRGSGCPKWRSHKE